MKWGSSSRNVNFHIYRVHSDAKCWKYLFSVKKCSFSARDAVLMQKCDLYVENADFTIKMWELWWEHEICTKCSVLDAKYWLYVKNDDFSHTAVEMMIIVVINM